MNTHNGWFAALISFIAGLLVFTSALAAENIPVNREITQIRTFTTYAHIVFQNKYNNSQGCGSSKTRVAIDWDGIPDRKAMLATAMLAYATNKSVGFMIDGCHGSGVPAVIRVSVKN